MAALCSLSLQEPHGHQEFQADLQECQEELQDQAPSRSSRETFCAQPLLLRVAARRQDVGLHVWGRFSFTMALAFFVMTVVEAML